MYARTTLGLWKHSMNRFELLIAEFYNNEISFVVLSMLHCLTFGEITIRLSYVV